jgi:hypothetical protein
MRWSALIKTLERLLSNWPSVLIPLIADYAAVRVFEWDATSVLSMTTVMGGLVPIRADDAWRTFDLRKYDIYTKRTRLLHFRSLGSIEEGPTKWAVDLEFSPNLDALFGIGVSSAEKDSRLTGVWFHVNASDAAVSLDNKYPHQRVNAPIHRIYVTVDKRRNKLEFKYQAMSFCGRPQKEGSLLDGLGVLRLPGPLDELYPAVSISGHGCTISLVDR